VYHATTGEGGDELAIKIYKTSILVFKDRDRYVTGEFRFRKGYAKHNPRKMVRLWAEKEMRNLLRLNQAGIPSPKPVLLKMHVLVMTFIGKQGWAAPRLKDAELDLNKYEECYLQMVRVMRTLYHTCRLVHADLSEYNILYYKGKCYIIDVSQSVEHDHPHALEFLRMDCYNITVFFRKKGVTPMRTKELFDFVTDLSITDVDAYLQKMQDVVSNREHNQVEEEAEDEVFRQIYIPRTLEEVIDYEQDIEKAGRGDQLSYLKLTGVKLPSQHNEIEDLKSEIKSSEKKKPKKSATSTTPAQTDTAKATAAPKKTAKPKTSITAETKTTAEKPAVKKDATDMTSILAMLPKIDGQAEEKPAEKKVTKTPKAAKTVKPAEEVDPKEESGEESSEEDSESESDEDEELLEGEDEEGRSKRILKKQEDKDDKKARKKEAKLAQRERRKTKMPKHLKKRKQKIAKQKK
jgi:RIO kinase 1